MFVNTYAQALVLDPTSDADAVTRLRTLRIQSPQIQYSCQVWLLDSTGLPSIDITQYVEVDSSSSVSWDGNSDVQNSVSFRLKQQDLQWGLDQVAVYALIQGPLYNSKQGYDPTTWLRFPLGRYVVTSPGYDDLDMADTRDVTGYGLNYLLQSEPTDSYAYDVGSTYLTAITGLFRGAGVLGGSAALNTICDYPGSWATKTLAQPANYPVGSDATFLDIINDLLAASGCQPVWVHPSTNRWVIDTIYVPATQSPRWLFAGSADPAVSTSDLDAKLVQTHTTQYDGDVHGIANRWVFIQNGRTIVPTEGQGQYTVNNLDTAPSGQNIVGRIITDVVMLDASGQTDLQAQGDAHVTDVLASIEQITVQSAPWPCGRNKDVFTFVHSALPGGSTRQVQTASWQFFLFGDPTTWDTKVVSAQ